MSAAESSSPGSSRGTAEVAVAAGVEAALADVERQLARQASALRLVHSAPATTPVTLVAAPAQLAAPPVPAPPTARPSPVRVVPPASPSVAAPVPVVVPTVGDEVFGDDDLEIATDTAADVAPPPPTARRPVARRIDIDELSPEQRAALGRLQARKVGRVVRDVSPWSVFKFSVLFWVCVWLILTVAGVILWKVGEGAGVVANIEKFYAKASGEKTFEIDGRGVFRAGASMGAVLVVSLTGLSVLISVLFNLVTDLTGGIRLSVVELESTRRPVRATRAGRSRAGSAPVPTVSASDELGEEADEEIAGPQPAPDDGVNGRGERDRAPVGPSAVDPPIVPTLVPESLVDDGDTDGDPASVRSAAR